MSAGRADLLRMRRLAHAIDGEREKTAADVVTRMLAVQAQDFAAGCWALAVRTSGVRRSEVLAELDAGRIVRSWPMRGTLHFVPPDRLRWMLSITSERMIAGLARRHRELELETAGLARASDLATSALAGGGRLSRAELMELWERNGIATGGQRGYHLIYYLAQTGVLCWGPTHGSQQALVLLDEWVPAGEPLDRDEALAAFLLGYLRGHGPATIADFVWWTKGTVAGAKTAIAVLGDTLTTMAVDGIDYLVTAEFADRAAEHRPTRSEREAVQLLPAFDEYLLGYRDRSPVIDDDRFERVVPGGNGIFAPILIAGGRVAGIWRRTPRTGLVEPLLFDDLTTGQVASLKRATSTYLRYAD